MNRHTIIVISITLFFFLLPFSWFKPGEMDLGGDNSRLFFYDPISYLTSYAFYAVSPSGVGGENIGYFMVGFVLFLIGLKSIIFSPTTLIAFFHGLNLSMAFLACYGVVRELLNTENSEKRNINHFVALIAGIFYVLSPIGIYGWDKVLITHNQFFLNPVLFFFLLRYFKTDKTFYLAITLLTTFLFSPNFSFAAAHGFLAFYPLSLLFLFIFRLVILGKKIIWKHIFVFLLIFILLQLFHVLPQLASMLSPGSVLNTVVFSNEGKLDRGLNYFVAIAPSVKVSINIMNLPQSVNFSFFHYFFIIFPLIIVTGLIYNKKKTTLLTGAIFLVILFFSSANITNIGFAFYKALFDLPGFSIFRNFYGQWMHALLFFSTILFGQTLAIVFLKLKKSYRYLLSFCIILLLVIASFPFINGSLVNRVLWQSNNVSTFMRMDPQYEEVLKFIHSLPDDGKILTLPLADYGYQIIRGTNNGAYQGPSTISYLAGKQDFISAGEFGKYQKALAEYIEKKEYIKLKNLLGMHNIKYIFYNADPNTYDDAFPAFPYIDVRRSFPATQQEYRQLLKELSLKQIKAVNNKYFVFEVDNSFYQPKIFTTNKTDYFPKRIEDWSLPLSFQKQNQFSAFFNSEQAPSTIDNTFTELEKKSILPAIIKNPDPPHFLHNAFAKTAPSSIFYKPTVIKEYIDLQKGKDSFGYIDKRMFLSAKLLYELELWGHDIHLSESLDTGNFLDNVKQVDDKRTMLWELNHSGNNWESILSRYYRNFVESIAYIKNAQEDQEWKEKEKFLIYEYILNHSQRFSALIDGSKKPTDEKVILDKSMDKIFEYLLSDLQLPDLNKLPNEYAIPAMQTEDKSIDLYMAKKESEQFDQGHFSLRLNEQELNKSLVQDEQEWIKLDVQGIDFNKPGKLEIVTKSSLNLIDTAQFMTIETPGSNITELSKNIPLLIWRNGLTWRIEDWHPKDYYILSFDFLTSGREYSLRFYEQGKKHRENQDVNLLFENKLKSQVWTKYQAVVLSGENEQVAFLQIGADNIKTPLAQLEIKNISLTYMPQPNIVLKTKNNLQHKEKLPKLTYTKINPTKYKITVNESNKPFYLVFNQAFNNKWKLYQVKDGASETADDYKLLDLKFWETFNKKPIFDNTHSSVNDIGNAWYIDPAQIKNNGSYTLILEMITQRYFYVGLIISLVAFVGVIFYLVYLLFHHEK